MAPFRYRDYGPWRWPGELTFAIVEADRIGWRRILPPLRRSAGWPPGNLARSDQDVGQTPREVIERVQRTLVRTGRLTPALAVA